MTNKHTPDIIRKLGRVSALTNLILSETGHVTTTGTHSGCDQHVPSCQPVQLTMSDHGHGELRINQNWLTRHTERRGPDQENPTLLPQLAALTELYRFIAACHTPTQAADNILWNAAVAAQIDTLAQQKLRVPSTVHNSAAHTLHLSTGLDPTSFRNPIRTFNHLRTGGFSQNDCYGPAIHNNWLKVTDEEKEWGQKMVARAEHTLKYHFPRHNSNLRSLIPAEDTGQQLRWDPTTPAPDFKREPTNDPKWENQWRTALRNCETNSGTDRFLNTVLEHRDHIRTQFKGRHWHKTAALINQTAYCTPPETVQQHTTTLAELLKPEVTNKRPATLWCFDHPFWEHNLHIVFGHGTRHDPGLWNHIFWHTEDLTETDWYEQYTDQNGLQNQPGWARYSILYSISSRADRDWIHNLKEPLLKEFRQLPRWGRRALRRKFPIWKKLVREQKRGN